MVISRSQNSDQPITAAWFIEMVHGKIRNSAMVVFQFFSLFHNYIYLWNENTPPYCHVIRQYRANNGKKKKKNTLDGTSFYPIFGLCGRQKLLDSHPLRVSAAWPLFNVDLFDFTSVFYGPLYICISYVLIIYSFRWFLYLMTLVPSPDWTAWSKSEIRRFCYPPLPTVLRVPVVDD